MGGLLENFVSSINIAFTEKKSLLLSIYIFFSCCLHCTPVWVRLPVWVPPFCCVNLLARPKVYAHPPTNTHTNTYTRTDVRLPLLQPFCKFHVHYICKFALFIYARQCAEHNEHTTYNVQHTNTHIHRHSHAHRCGKPANAHTLTCDWGALFARLWLCIMHEYFVELCSLIAIAF